MQSKPRMPLFLLSLALLVMCGMLICLLPHRTFSELENRTLTEWPDPSGVSLTDGSWGEKVESYAADHFPLRDALISGRSLLRLLAGDRYQTDTLAGRDGWLFEAPPDVLNRNATRSVETLSAISEGLHLPGYLMIIPTSAEILPENLPALYTCGRQSTVLTALSQSAGALQWVSSTLPEHAGNGTLYYRTDHHLTADGAALCYWALCDALSIAPQTGRRITVPGFRGSYFARVPSPSIASEDFSADLPEGVSVTLDGEMAEGFLNAELLEKRNKYAALLGGTYAHAVLENPQGEGRLLILCDSYANAIAPMLSASYARIDLVDPRYFSGDLAALAQEAQPNAMLAIFGLNTLTTNRSILLMDIPERSTVE